MRDRLETGLAAPICLTWELTYGCNLACIHCLSSSGRRDPAELTTAEAVGVIDELHEMQVFYVNIGGGEPMLRPDFFDLVSYSVEQKVGVKFSTNGTRIDAEKARRLAAMDYVDVQISIDGADAATNDPVRGEGTYAAAVRAMEHLAAAGFGAFKISVVITRHNVEQLDAFEALAARFGAQLRLTRLRPSGRGADTWGQLHPLPEQQRRLYGWLVERPGVLTGDSFFHLSALGDPLEGLNLCGAGRVVCLIDPIGDVYACPFVIARGVPRRQRARGGGLLRGLALLAALRAPPRAGEPGRMRLLRQLRRLPRGLHGGEVLHRPAPRGTGPRVRLRQWSIGARARAGPLRAPSRAGPLPPARSGAAEADRRARAAGSR